jgi:uncharacterized membrane protein
LTAIDPVGDTPKLIPINRICMTPLSQVIHDVHGRVDCTARPLWTSALIGAATGLRTMMAPAALSRARHVHPAARALLLAAAAGELVADKLPGIPNRIEPGPLLGRITTGAIAGGVLARRNRRSAAAGALLGGAAAAAGAVAGYHARRALTQEAGLPDLPVALAEDMLAITAARRAMCGHVPRLQGHRRP